MADPQERGWNPRYSTYAAAHNLPPEAMLAYDREQWPGGCMTGFILWIHEKWRTWAEALGYDPPWKSDAHVEDFERFIHVPGAPKGWCDG